MGDTSDDERENSSAYETDEDEDSSDYEPQLKYQRLVGSLPSIFEQENNTATALCVSDKLIILGTNLGFLYILNFEGYCGELKFRPHVGAVRDISIDITGEFVASCSDDGKIVVRNLYEAANSQYQQKPSTKTDNLDFLLKGGVSCVQIDPEFGRRNERGVVCGGRPGRLILMKKGM
jgi:WD40 repeat protein